MFSQLGTVQGMWDRYSASRRRQGVRRMKHKSFLLVFNHASSPKSASAGGQGKKLGGNWGVAGKTISLYFYQVRGKRKIFLEWDKRNERHEESQTWDISVTLSRAGNTEIFEGIRLIEEKKTTKEYLSFNKLATDISLSSRESWSSLPTLFFCWDLFTTVSESLWSFLT